MAEPEETPNTPPDWRDWINEFPTMKSLAIFCLTSWMITPLVMTVEGFLISNGFVSSAGAIDAVLSLTDKWLDALNWLTTAAVFGVVVKRAVTSADVVRAEGEVKANAVVAAAAADAVKTTGTFPVPAAAAAPAPAVVVAAAVPFVASPAPSKHDDERGE